MWSTWNVTVPTACIKPNIAPPRIPAIIPYQGPYIQAAQAPNQVPIIIMPSKPILTIPVLSENIPPSPARHIGMASLIAAPNVPLVVNWSYLSTWAIKTIKTTGRIIK